MFMLGGMCGNSRVRAAWPVKPVFTMVASSPRGQDDWLVLYERRLPPPILCLARTLHRQQWLR